MFYRILTWVAPLLLICAVECGYSGELSINSCEGNMGAAVSFAVSVNNAPNDLQALIMDVRYDPDAMTFTGYDRGGLAVSGYPMMIVNEYQPGVIRVGAVDPIGSGVIEGESGDFLHLNFQVTGNKESAVTFGTLKDDLKGWSVSSGRLYRQDLEQDLDAEQEESANSSERKNATEDESQTPYSQDSEESRSQTAATSALNMETDQNDAGEATNESASAAETSFERPQSNRGVQEIKLSSGKSRTNTPSSLEAKSENFAAPASTSGAANASMKEKIEQIKRIGLDSSDQIANKFSSSRKKNGASSDQTKAGRTRTGGQAENGTAVNNVSSLFVDQAISPEWLARVVAVLLILSMSMVAALLLVLGGILFMLILLYRRLGALEKAGMIEYRAPFVIRASPGDHFQAMPQNKATH
ncbi:cohesin domain-containing protein [Desulfatibacillum aliphaticivorans]|uniref:cohesin domain-containing protein n=1 Tax=Desulfatibacillum aliphaticivorans TaxID=218208 RepID=UPI000410D041|nr:cohesin domain-containing protein [Desulfatibacillum aliphaticivorans]